MTDDEKADEAWKKKEEEKKKQQEKDYRDKQDQKEKDDANTFKVTDSWLIDFAHTKLTTMLQDLQTHPTRVALQQFVLGIGGGTAPGDYSHLFPGAGTVQPSVQKIKDTFTNYCKSLEQQFKTLEDQVKKMIDDLERAQRDLKNGADDALSAAQMMYLISDVLGTGGSLK
ncbi:hypothetical protein [Kitasatospora sp. NPDC087314]|uniref:hypothetical protein n=1 Tax=Kitasatospora sp. NPDC087314 TaxID=3364068 RepID=UPI00380F8F90